MRQTQQAGTLEELEADGQSVHACVHGQQGNGAAGDGACVFIRKKSQPTVTIRVRVRVRASIIGGGGPAYSFQRMTPVATDTLMMAGT